MKSLKAFYLVAVVSLIAVSDGEGFFHKRKSSPPQASDYFRKLGIEKAEKGTFAPPFSLDDLSGKRVSLAELRGKVVFANFWATWCVPCRLEMPTMEKLHREMKGRGLEVVAINIQENRDEVRKFVEELGLTFTILLDKDGEVSKAYGAWAIPVTYFIGKKGELIGKVMGYREWDQADAKAFFSQLLAPSLQPEN